MESPRPKDLVEELLALGYSKQQVFDQVTAAQPEMKPGRVADALRNRATLMAKKRYMNAHRVLLALILVNAVLRLWRTVDARMLGEAHAFQFLGLIPFATLFATYGIYRWQGEHFQWVGWLNVLGAIGVLGRLGTLARHGRWDTPAAMDMLSLIIGILCLYLANRVFAQPRKVKDPLGGPVRYVFPEGGL